MQRAPCSCSVVSGRWSWNSSQSRTRAFGSRPRRLVPLVLHEAGQLAHSSLGPYVPYLPPRRAASFEFSSKAAISASSWRQAGGAHLRLRLQHAAVVVRHHAHERRHQLVPRRQDLLRRASSPVSCAWRDTRLVHLPRSPPASSSLPRLTISLLQRRANDARLVVQHVGDAARHAGGEVAPRRAEHDDAPAGHVLAAVVAHALDDGAGAAVADAEALAGHAADVRLAAGRAVERDVADEDVLLGDERRLARRIDDRACRPTAPCRRSRWRRPPASASCRAARTRRSSGPPSP